MLKKIFFNIILIFLSTIFFACSNSSNISEDILEAKETKLNTTNPFFNKSTLTFGYPHFDKIKNSVFVTGIGLSKNCFKEKLNSRHSGKA